MKYLTILILVLAGVVLLGHAGVPCIGCQTEGITKSHSDALNHKAITPHALHSKELIMQEAIYFTEKGAPITLMLPSQLSKDRTPVSVDRIYDSRGFEIDAKGFVAVSLIQPRVINESDAYQSKTTYSKNLVKQSQRKLSAAIQARNKIISETIAVPTKPLAHQVKHARPNTDSPAELPKDTLENIALVSFPQRQTQHTIYESNDKLRVKSDQFIALNPISSVTAFPQPTLPSIEPFSLGTQSRVGLKQTSLQKQVFKQPTRLFETDSSSSDSDETEDEESEITEINDRIDGLASDLEDTQDSLAGVLDNVATLQGQLGETDVVDLVARFDELGSQLNAFEDKTYAGIASTSALVTAIPSEPGKTIVNLGYGYYEGQNAIGLSVSKRMSKINGYYYSGVATGLSEVKTPLIRAGVGIEF